MEFLTVGTYTSFWEPDDGLPYTPLSYVNGPGYYTHRTVNGSLVQRMNLTGVDTSKKHVHCSCVTYLNCERPLILSLWDGISLGWNQPPITEIRALRSNTFRDLHFVISHMVNGRFTVNKDLQADKIVKYEYFLSRPTSLPFDTFIILHSYFDTRLVLS